MLTEVFRPTATDTSRSYRALRGFDAPGSRHPLPATSGGTNYRFRVNLDRVVFSELASQWRRETAHLSSLDDICEHPCYREIVAMKWKAVPFILDELKRSHEQWFDALSEITGQDPVPDSDSGNVRLMAKHWISWGYENGLI
jgi:hypothetical protein